MLFAIIAAMLLTGCGLAPGSSDSVKSDETRQPWYAQTVEQLAAMDREAEGLFQKGKRDEAAAVIERAEPLETRLVSVREPSYEAMVAASDLDRLYGRMLFTNKRYGWARLLFQKNLARWKHWQPPTPETARRLKEAESDIAECDKRLEE
jgi:hypothetical protein